MTRTESGTGTKSALSSHWTVPAELNAVPGLVMEAAEFLEAHGIQGRPATTTQLALEELATNVARHRTEPSRHCRIRVDLELGPEEIRITVEDDGGPFDPIFEAPTPDLNAPLEERTPGGLGLYLVKSMVEGFDYHRHDGLNHVRMSVRRAS